MRAAVVPQIVGSRATSRHAPVATTWSSRRAARSMTWTTEWLLLFEESVLATSSEVQIAATGEFWGHHVQQL